MYSLNMGVSDGWDHTQFLTMLSLILFHVVLGVTTGCFVQPDVLRNYFVLPSESINKRKSGDTKNSQEYRRYFQYFCVYVGAIVSLPSWTGMWHIYTHP